MELSGKHTVVTGAANGIGRAIALRFHAQGAKVVLADLELGPVQEIVNSLNAVRPESAMAVVTDVGSEEANASLISQAKANFGPVDLFFANAGIGGGTDLSTSEESWSNAFNINVHAHRWAAKYLLPDWLERGHGYFCSTASAAGLLSQIGSAPYSLTKHAAVAFAEWLSITYGNRGIRVSCLCPQGVNTDMLRGSEELGGGASVVRSAGNVLEPEHVADIVADAIAAERFLILPHPEVAGYMAKKATDHERWLAGMRKLQFRVLGV